MVRLRAAIKDQAPERIVNSEAALDATLDDASTDARAAGKLNIVLLTAPNRDWLSIVVGGEDHAQRLARAALVVHHQYSRLCLGHELLGCVRGTGIASAVPALA